MNQFKFALIILFSTGLAYPKSKVVYGEDNRLDIFQVDSLIWRGLALSTAAMVPKTSIVDKGGDKTVEGETLNESMELCPGEKFGNQKTPAICSGFLLGERLLITAGHCGTKSNCKEQDWVFGMYQKEDSDDLTIPPENIYSCKQIIARTQDSSTMEDWAIIELDRKVEGIPHVQVRTEGRISLGAPLIVIGNPSGLPTKIAGGAFVRQNDDVPFFQANLDTFGGNSGSAVFNAETGVVEGILVRGEVDYEEVTENGKNCYRVKKCKMDECRGEDVQRIPSIINYLLSGDY